MLLLFFFLRLLSIVLCRTFATKHANAFESILVITWRWASLRNAMPSRFTHNSIFILPWTRKFVWIKRGGCVDIWHSYNPSSLLFVSAIRSRQLFGYWKSTLNRGSPLYVCVPTVNNCKCSSFRSRFTHETYRCAHDKIHCERTQRSKEEKSDIRKKKRKKKHKYLSVWTIEIDENVWTFSYGFIL